MYKFQKPKSRICLDNKNVAVKNDPNEDEVDRATPSQSIFDPNSTSTSIYDYEDDFDDNYGVTSTAQEFCSLPVQVANLNNLDSIYFSSATHQHWEAEDVGDFITTLDESSSSGDDFIDFPQAKKVKQRPKSLYNPSAEMFYATKESLTNSAGPPVEKLAKIMTTSCYGVLTPENTNCVGSDPLLEICHISQLDISCDLTPSILADLDGNQRQWMASTEEIIQINQDIESMIQQRVTVDVHGIGGDRCLSTTDDNLVSLENSYCEPQHQITCVELAELAESGEWYKVVILFT